MTTPPARALQASIYANRKQSKDCKEYEPDCDFILQDKIEQLKVPTESINTVASNKYAYGQFLDIEDMVINTSYAVTFNPCDAHQYFQSGRNRIRNFVDYWKNYFNVQPYKVELHLEISPKGRLHWHGYITFIKETDLMNFYIIMLHDLLTRVQIKIQTIDKPEEWKTYILKQDKLFHLYALKTDGKSASKNFRAMVSTQINDNFLISMDKYMKD